MTDSSDQNPYESPRAAGESTSAFREGDSEVVELRRRVEELEKRLVKNWLVSPHRILRALGVMGYFLMGYAIFAAIIYGIMGLVMLVWYLFSLPNLLP